MKWWRMPQLFVWCTRMSSLVARRSREQLVMMLLACFSFDEATQGDNARFFANQERRPSTIHHPWLYLPIDEAFANLGKEITASLPSALPLRLVVVAWKLPKKVSIPQDTNLEAQKLFGVSLLRLLLRRAIILALLSASLICFLNVTKSGLLLCPSCRIASA